MSNPTTNTTNITNTTILDEQCGVNFTCDLSNSRCYLPPTGPICSDLTNIGGYKWRLNSTVFPPIEYLGNQQGVTGGQCESFNYSSWSWSNKTWLLDYLRHHWVPNNGTFSYNNNTIPAGTFINPLDYIGSCFGPNFCSNQICIRKYRSPSSCNSTNQCFDFICGNLTIVNNITEALSNVTFTCVDDNESIINILTNNQARPWNVIPPNNLNHFPNSPNTQYDRPPAYSGQAVAVIAVIVIIFFLIAIGCCIKRFNSSVDTDIDNRSVGGRVRRTGSVLGGGGLSRGNSIRTLPPYTEMAEEEPSDQQGVITALTRYFFPPGELPPPYDSIESRTEDIRRLSTLNYVSDVQDDPNAPIINNSEEMNNTTLDEVRDGVTFEEVTPSEPLSRRSTITRHEGSSTNPLVLPEARDTSFDKDQDQVDETSKLHTQLENEK
ncbi:4268_t:CDS:1 [Dentiscutata erythropus]|uniref:4268_t:CDS:1 n=1 Tax=Dentiscutata erythropus TaxID=1348616 RepID=A0A9N9EXK8_9GLOM|nr:4268_t:CDS:1 [Dentiscutata erythropus]